MDTVGVDFGSLPEFVPFDDPGFDAFADQLTAIWAAAEPRPVEEADLSYLATLPTGSVAASMLTDLDTTGVSGRNRVSLLQARIRSHSHFQALIYEDIAAIHDACTDLVDPELAWEAAASEIRAALRLTRRAADHHLDLALALRDRLPAVLAALKAGEIDQRRATVIVRCHHPSPRRHRPAGRRPDPAPCRTADHRPAPPTTPQARHRNRPRHRQSTIRTGDRTASSRTRTHRRRHRRPDDPRRPTRPGRRRPPPHRPDRPIPPQPRRDSQHRPAPRRHRPRPPHRTHPNLRQLEVSRPRIGAPHRRPHHIDRTRRPRRTPRRIRTGHRRPRPPDRPTTGTARPGNGPSPTQTAANPSPPASPDADPPPNNTATSPPPTQPASSPAAACRPSTATSTTAPPGPRTDPPSKTTSPPSAATTTDSNTSTAGTSNASTTPTISGPAPSATPTPPAGNPPEAR